MRAAALYALDEARHRTGEISSWSADRILDIDRIDLGEMPTKVAVKMYKQYHPATAAMKYLIHVAAFWLHMSKRESPSPSSNAGANYRLALAAASLICTHDRSTEHLNVAAEVSKQADTFQTIWSGVSST